MITIKHNNAFISVIAWLLACFAAVDADARQRLYGIGDLSSNLISSVCQDSLGYIWVGTAYGLNRFDGVYFVQYTADGNEGLSNDDISRLLPGNGGDVWVVMYSDVQLYSVKDNRFHDVKFKGCDKVGCRDILQTPEGEIWLLNSGNGIWRVDRETMTASPIEKINKAIGKPLMKSMRLDSHGRLWIVTPHDALLMYDTKTGKVHRYFNDTPIANSIVDVVEVRGGRMALATHNSGVFLFDGKKDTWTKVCDAPGMTVMQTFGSKSCDMLLGSDTHGMWRVDFRRKCVVPAYQSVGVQGMPRMSVAAFCEDNDGNAWIGFYKSGLFFVSNHKEPFGYIDASLLEGDNGRSILAVYGFQNDNVLVCQEGGGIAEVTLNGEVRNRWLSGRGFLSVLPAGDGRSWVGGFSCGAGLLDMRTGEVKWLNALKNGGHVKSMVYDKSGNIYMAVSGRYELLSFTPDGVVRRLCGGKMRLHNDWFNVLKADSRGLIWIGHCYGIDVYDPKHDRMVELKMDSVLRVSTVYAIAESTGGLIWIGTNKGLYSYDFAKGAWKHYGKAEGLSNETVCGIVEGRDGGLWVSTFKGLCRLDMKTLRFTNYYKGSGLKYDNYALSIYGSMPSGLVYFGNDRGVTFFMPEEVRISNFQRGITLTGVFISGQQVALEEDNSIRLGYMDNTFTLRFSTMDFREFENVYYEYRFADEPKGVWHRTSVGVSEITFSHFSPGHYVLQVRAHEGNVVSDIKQIDIRITPPWWRSWWAYTFYVLVALGVVVLFFVSYMHKQQAEHNESEVKFLIDIGHELRSPLTLIKSPLDALLRNDYDSQTKRALGNMKRNTDRMLQLVNQMLSIRRIEKGHLKLHYAETDLAEFVEDICQDYKYEAEKRNVKLTFDADDGVLKAWIDRDNFDKVVNNLLTNAMKYVGEGGEVSVRLRADGKKCRLSVVDNGTGIDEQQIKNVFNRFYQASSCTASNQMGFGIGLNLTYKLVQLHGGEIVARNRTDGTHGAEFIVTLPLGKSHLPKDCIVGDEFFTHLSSSEIARAEDTSNVVTEEDGQRKVYRNLEYKVAVVDDDEEIRNFLKVELGDVYRVSVYSDGNEALNAIIESQPDLVVSDVMMPGMDGFTLLHRLKNNTRTSHIPVVLLTTKVEHESHVEGFEYGADAYMDKPFDLAELKACIGGLIANRNRVKGKFSGIQEQEKIIKPIEMKGNDAQLMERIMKIVNEKLSDTDFNVGVLAEEVALSRVQLHRRVKEITGITVGEFIRNLRMQQAAKLLEQGNVTISQVTYAIGMGNPNNFSVTFKRYFGVTPSEYMAKHAPKDISND